MIELRQQQRSRRRLNLPLVLGGVLVLFLVSVAFFGPMLAPHDPMENYFMMPDRNGELKMAPFEPGEVPGFPLGSDLDGRDIVSRLLWAVRPTLILTFLVSTVRLVLGTILGFIEGWYGGVLGDALASLTKVALGLPIIIVTNQSGIGRGYFTENTLTSIHSRLQSMLPENDINIADIFYCPHVPGTGCECRKPAPGMLLRAAEKHGIDLAKSYVIGDRMMDVEMAHAVRAIGILVPEPGDQYSVGDEIEGSEEGPDFMADDFLGAAEWLRKHISEV